VKADHGRVFGRLLSDVPFVIEVPCGRGEFVFPNYVLDSDSVFKAEFTSFDTVRMEDFVDVGVVGGFVLVGYAAGEATTDDSFL